MAGDRRRLIWSDDANKDLISIWEYGVEEWSEEIAQKHLLEIEHLCGRLIDTPMLGKSRDEIIAGIKSIAVRPHVIFYHLIKGEIEIVRVLHQRVDVEGAFRA
jgi:toxin ParE1/3/4